MWRHPVRRSQFWKRYNNSQDGRAADLGAWPGLRGSYSSGVGRNGEAPSLQGIFLGGWHYWPLRSQLRERRGRCNCLIRSFQRTPLLLTGETDLVTMT
jgi:hypothetical protein